MDIQQQIFGRLLSEGHPLILEPQAARQLITVGDPGRGVIHGGQAFIARRLAARGLRPIKIRGRWVVQLAEIARFLAAPAPAEAAPASAGAARRGPGRPRKTAAPAGEVRHG